MTQKRSAGCALARRRNMSQATARDARMCQGTFFILKMKTNKKQKVPKQLPLPSALCKNKEFLSLLSAF